MCGKRLACATRHRIKSSRSREEDLRDRTRLQADEVLAWNVELGRSVDVDELVHESRSYDADFA